MAREFHYHPFGARAVLSNSPGISGTSFILQTGQGALFPDPATYGPYPVAFWPPDVPFTNAVAEVGIVTAKAVNTLTVTRAQDGTSAKVVASGWIIAASVMNKLFEDIENYFTGNVPPYTVSTSLSEDIGGTGRMRLAREGFIFKGPSFLDETRAGSLLQIGEYPSLSDGAGSYVGAGNAAVFITQDDMFNAVGPPETYAGLAITGQNSDEIINYFAIGVWAERNSNGGNAWGMEIDILNRGTPGGGLGIILSGNKNYSGTEYADRALVITSAGTPNGSPDADSANWLTGIQIDGIVPSLGRGIIISDGITGSLGMVDGIHMRDVWGGFSHAAIFFHNEAKIMWQRTDDTNDGAYIQQDSADNLVIRPSSNAGVFYVWHRDVAHIAFTVNPFNPPGSSLNTTIQISYDAEGTAHWNEVVIVGAANSGGAGYRVLRVPN